MWRRSFAASFLLLASTTGHADPQLFEGDVVHHADRTRAHYDVQGEHVKVCVISTNLKYRDVAKELPSTIDVQISGVIKNNDTDGEGTAMLEIIHRLAPKADLGFASTADDAAGFVTAFNTLVAAHCKVIVDDVDYRTESPFQGGAIDKAIDAAVAKNVVVVSSASNLGNQKHMPQVWEGDFLDSSQTITLSGTTYAIHTFTSDKSVVANPLSAVRIANPNATQACGYATLYWNDPLGGSTNDYALVSFLSNGTAVGSSGRAQSGAGFDPRTTVGVFPGGKISILKKSGSESRFLHLQVDAGCGSIEYNTPGATFGHSASESVISVGATSVLSTTTSINNNTIVEAESADGPRRIFFSTDGTALTTPGGISGKTLNKPDVTGAASVSTDLPAPYVRFKGTSAAAPHIAAIAALLLSRKSDLTLPQIRLALYGSAVDIEDKGWDLTSGYGVPMADKAVALVDGMKCWGSLQNVLAWKNSRFEFTCDGWKYTGRRVAFEHLKGVPVGSVYPGKLFWLPPSGGLLQTTGIAAQTTKSPIVIVLPGVDMPPF
jgi:hypothetical protein